MKGILKKWSFWLVVVLIAAGTGGYLYMQWNPQKTTNEAGEAQLQLATVRRGELVLAASGAGTLVPSWEISLAPSVAGELLELNVAVGDHVKAGDILARVDDTSARQAVVVAERQVEAAKLSLQEMQSELADLQQGPDEATRLAAEAELAAAQEALAELEQSPSAADLLAAEATLKEAQEAYQDALNGPDPDEIRQLELKLAQAKNSLWSQQMNRDATCGNKRAGASACDQAEANVLNGEISVQLAQLALDQAKEPPSEAELASLKAKVATAQQQLDELKSSPSAAELAQARARVASAEQALAELEPDPEELAEAQAKVTQAEKDLEQAQLQLAKAQRDLENTTIVAPADGTVMAINGQVGETVGTGELIVLADTAHPLIEVYVDETDLDKIAVGYEAEIVLDVLPDKSFAGQVISVEPQLTTSSGVDVVKGLIQPNDPSFGQPASLPMGLNASVDVIGGRAENALLVPIEALREIEADRYGVFVMEDGQLRFREVEVGLCDLTYAEIKSGLRQGDQVSTGIMETR